MGKKVAIIGTAQTWREAPWDDESVELWGINDAYSLGWQRQSAWFDMHPFDRMVFRKPGSRVKLHEIPVGSYLRPQGHLEWLRARAAEIPVWLQHDPPPGWPGLAQRYPVEEITAKFRKVLRIDPTWTKDYVTSGPAWMILLAIYQQVEQIAIYGIHLATEREYMDQRANFEYLLGYALGLGIDVTMTRTSPVLKGRHVYCYEPRAWQHREPIKHRMAQVDKQAQEMMSSLVDAPWWRPAAKSALKRTLHDLHVERADLMQQMNRLQLEEELQSPEWRP